MTQAIRHSLGRWTLLCCAGLFCLSLTVSGIARAEVDPEAAGLQLENISEELDKLQSWMRTAESKRSRLEKDLKSQESRINRVSSSIRDLRRSHRTLKTEQRKLELELTRLNQQLAEQKFAMEQQIRASFIAGRNEYLKVLLSQNGASGMMRNLRYYDYLHEMRLRHIRQYRETQALLQEKEVALSAQERKLSHTELDLARQQKQLEKARNKRKNTLHSLARNMKQKDQRVRQLEKDREQLEQLLAEVLATMPELAMHRSGTPFAKLKGALAWPAEGRIQQTFGTSTGTSLLHGNGVRIAASAGSEVRAVHGGHVVFSEWMRRFGLLLIIDHGDGYMTLYAHNESLLREAGDWVSPGEAIATVGDSGGQESPGLYFEIRQQGKPVNPVQWCREGGSTQPVASAKTGYN